MQILCCSAKGQACTPCYTTPAFAFRITPSGSSPAGGSDSWRQCSLPSIGSQLTHRDWHRNQPPSSTNIHRAKSKSCQRACCPLQHRGDLPKKGCCRQRLCNECSDKKECHKDCLLRPLRPGLLSIILSTWKGSIIPCRRLPTNTFQPSASSQPPKAAPEVNLRRESFASRSALCSMPTTRGASKL